MSASSPYLTRSDLRGLLRLASDATLGVTDLVEAVQQRISKPIWRGTGISRLVYGSVRGVSRGVSWGLDTLLSRLPAKATGPSSPQREALLAALNGVLGDHLLASANPLAISMSWRRQGRVLDAAAVAAMPAGSKRLLILVHGLCMNDLQWLRHGHDHGAMLAAQLGYTPIYLHYNSGLHISSNGRALADQLDSLLRDWPQPVDELVLLGHSMGGLVSRAACHYGAESGHGWLGKLRAMVFLGTPHHGAPLERGGHWVDVALDAAPYAAPFARLGKIRSAGITDLRYGNVLESDWQGHDRFHRHGDLRTPTALPAGVAAYAIAGTTGKQAGDLKDRLLGDGLVPLASALGRHDDPGLDLGIAADRQWVAYGTHHMDLLSSSKVGRQLVDWLADKP